MRQHLYVNQSELVKEMNQCISFDLGKPSYVSKRLSPCLEMAFSDPMSLFDHSKEKLLHLSYTHIRSSMVVLVLESAHAFVSKWEENLEGQGGMEAEIEVDEDLRTFSANVISRAYFGSSHSKGKEILSKHVEDWRSKMR